MKSDEEETIRSIDYSETYSWLIDIEELRRKLAEVLLIPEEMLHEENRTDES